MINMLYFKKKKVNMKKKIEPSYYIRILVLDKRSKYRVVLWLKRIVGRVKMNQYSILAQL